MSLAENAPAAAIGVTTAGQSRSEPSRYLFGPLLDFMLLGGGSIFVMAAVWLLVPQSASRDVLLITALIAHLVNHPHFAHSYQIFYDGFRNKAFGNQYSAALRVRYVIAGVVVPVTLVAYFLAGILSSNVQMIGWGLNFMIFVTGWHYVKQGYGILMLDSALKKHFFDATEKKIFLVNAYATWILAWFWANQIIREKDAWWGIKAYTLAIPSLLLQAAMVAAIMTFLACCYVILRRQVNGKGTPWNGVVAYVVSIYPWMLFLKVSPIVAMIVPALHSLQYLAVVWRYQINRTDAEVAEFLGEKAAAPGSAEAMAPALRRETVKRFARFVITGTALGFMGFWAIPMVLDISLPYDKALFGSTLFIALFWLFINVHHYFLDNVMWRRENTDMKKYLFR